MNPFKSFRLSIFAISMSMLLTSNSALANEKYNKLPSDLSVVERFSERYNPPIHIEDQIIYMPQLVGNLKDKMVVMVGEVHNQYEQHLAQFAILKQLHQHNDNIAISVEWVQKKYQPILDAYLSDEISLESFMEQSNYDEHWGYDIRMFMPIFEYAKRHQIAIYAIDSPKELQRKIYYDGIDGLSQEDRQYLPKNLVELSKAQQTELDLAMRVHKVSDEKVKNLVKAHQVRDSALTENLLIAMNEGRHSQMLVFAGVNHVLSKRGISHILEKRLGDWNFANVSIQTKESLKHRYPTQYVIQSPQLYVMN